MIERSDAIESSVDVSASSALAVVVEEKERAMMGRAYADEAATSLRRSALEARAAANAFRARLYPDGDPESDDARMLVIVHAVLEGHPFDDASRDVTNAVRARLRSHGEERLVILVSENLCDLIPDDAVNAPMSLGAKISLRDVENTTNRRPATLRITYAFDVRDSQTGDVVKGDERMITIPVGAAGTPHAFAMQSVWLEAACTGIEDALKAAYSRLRDAESTASAAKVRAIALQGEAARMRHHGGSSARAQALERRELEIERREAQLNAEVVEIEGMVARAREEAEAMRREANRIVADASASLRVKDDEIERLRALQSSVTRAQNRSKSWRRETAAARLTADADADASDARRLAAAGNHRAAASSLENAERRLARITAACVAKSTSRALAPVENVHLCHVSRRSAPRAHLDAPRDMDEYYPDPDAPPRPPPPSSAPRTRAGATVAYGDPARTTVVVLPSARAPQTPPPSVPSQQIPTGLPVGQARPAYLGATRGHERQIVSCERCGHSGPADVVKVRGAASCFAGILTFGTERVLLRRRVQRIRITTARIARRCWRSRN